MARILAFVAVLTALLIPPASAQNDAECIGVSIETVVALTWGEITFTYSYGEGTRPDFGSGDICNAGSGTPEQPRQVDIEITGTNDPDASDSPTSPDLSCVLPVEAPSECSVTVTTVGPGMDILAAWIDLDGDDATVELDTEEGPWEKDDPGAPEPDATDAVSIEWIDPRCDDGIDNDGDGYVDHPDDLGCESTEDHSEASEGGCFECIPPECRRRTYPSIIIGTNGADILYGALGRDCVAGRGGDDIITGGRSDDLLIGGRGADSIEGGRGNDLLEGSGGDDLLRGNGADDELYGNEGNDRIYGGSGRDSVFGGRDRDRCAAERQSGCDD